MDIGFLIDENERHRNNGGVISSYSPTDREIRHFVGKKASEEAYYENLAIDLNTKQIKDILQTGKKLSWWPNLGRVSRPWCVDTS